MTRISLCMIVRDEEADLPRCLDSVRGVVDEVCLVDTGSLDRTEAIARERGARLERFEWCDDFAAARNASLAMARHPWILVIDADEAIESDGARARLELFAREHPREAGWVTIVDRQEEGDLKSRVTRFFPRACEPTFRGRFHEQVQFGGEHPPTAHTGVEVAHHGYRAEAIARKDKVARNRAFLQRLIAADPLDPYHHYQLGRTHLVAGECDAALAAFTEALERVSPDAPYLALLVELTGHTLRRLDRSLEALALLQQVAPAFAGRPDTCYLEALLALDVGHLELAEARFQRCLELEAVDGAGGSSAEAARTWGPAYHLGVMRECLGMPEEAAEYYGRALAFRPGHPESRAGLERLAAGGRPLRTE